MSNYGAATRHMVANMKQEKTPVRYRSQNWGFETMEVPTKTSLAEIYPDDAMKGQTKRWNELISTFKETYGKLPDFVSRSPGRVNIIGEVSRMLYE